MIKKRKIDLNSITLIEAIKVLNTTVGNHEDHYEGYTSFISIELCRPYIALSSFFCYENFWTTHTV